MGYVVDKAAVEEDSLRQLRLFGVYIIPLMFDINLSIIRGTDNGRLNAAVPRRHILTPKRNKKCGYRRTEGRCASTSSLRAKYP
jgi:hypothetical protein